VEPGGIARPRATSASSDFSARPRSGGAVALHGLIAAFAIVDGVMQIVFALDLRSVSRRALPGRA